MHRIYIFTALGDGLWWEKRTGRSGGTPCILNLGGEPGFGGVPSECSNLFSL